MPDLYVQAEIGNIQHVTCISYESYAKQPTKSGRQEMRAKVFMPSDRDGPSPLLVWLHSGGFRSGGIEHPAHDRLGEIMARQGYATAVLQYRLKALQEDLSPPVRAALPHLVAEARARATILNQAFVGAAALAAAEDLATFLGWVMQHQDRLDLSGRIMLGGSSAGGMTVLNVLSLTRLLEFDLPEISSAAVFSAAFAYPSYFETPPCPIFAISGSKESQIPVASMRAYAALCGSRCTFLEHPEHQHGDLRLTRAEPKHLSIRRLARFDEGRLKLRGELKTALVPAKRD